MSETLTRSPLFPRQGRAPKQKATKPASHWNPVPGLLLAAFAVRLAAYALNPGTVHADETFQYLEQAHRIVFGTGLTPWEYVMGVRSWIIPGALALIFAAMHPFGLAPVANLTVIAACMSLLSVIPVFAAFRWGARTGRMSAALAAGVLAAFAPQMVYYGAHPLADTICAPFLILGLLAVYPAPRLQCRYRYLLGGFLLGAAVMLRIQLAPAVLLAFCGVCGFAVRGRWLPMLLGATVPVIFSGVLDWVTWGRPFQSIWLYAWVNSAMGVADRFGLAPWYRYFAYEHDAWGACFVAVFALALWGGRTYPLLLGVVAAIFAPLMLVGHKEARFIFPALPLLMTLSGIGLADLLRTVLRRLGRANLESGLALGAAVALVGYAALAAPARPFHDYWRLGVPMVQAMRMVSGDPAACGLALDPATAWANSGGYTHLRPGIPIYRFDAGAPSQLAEAFNYVYQIIRKPPYLLSDSRMEGLGFSRVRCWGDIHCLWRRPGACQKGGASLLSPPPIPG